MKKASTQRSSSRSVSVRDIMLFLSRPILRTATLRNNEARVKAFTLIELLVVVLIIGILAAIALPQYQTAVNKSRYAGLMPLARSVKDAEEEIMMTKADYTADLGDLAVTPGTIDAEHTNTATHGHVTLNVVAGADAGQDYVKAVDSRNTDNTFVMYFAKSPKYPGEIHCEALTANTKAQQLCKSYGPVGTVTGTDNTYTTYVLQGTGVDATPAAEPEPEQTPAPTTRGAGPCSSNDCYYNNGEPTEMNWETYDRIENLKNYLDSYLDSPCTLEYVNATTFSCGGDGYSGYLQSISKDPSQTYYDVYKMMGHQTCSPKGAGWMCSALGGGSSDN